METITACKKVYLPIYKNWGNKTIGNAWFWNISWMRNETNSEHDTIMVWKI